MGSSGQLLVALDSFLAVLVGCTALGTIGQLWVFLGVLGMGFVEWMKHSCVSIVAQRMKVAKQVDAHRMLDSNSQSLLPMLAVLIDRNMYCAFVAIVS